jgi:hypothetical protein
MKERFATDGIEPVGSSPAEPGRFMNSERLKWAQVVKQSAASVD